MNPIPKNVEVEFYHTIGGIVIRYGFIDTLIADMCRIFFEDLGGHSSEKKPPRPISVRLGYLGKCFRNKPEVAHWKEVYEDFHELIEGVDGVRNYLIHGCLTQYFPDRTAFQFTKLDRNADETGYQQNSVTYTKDQLVQFAHACTEIVRNLQMIGRDLEQVVVRKKQSEQR